MQHGGKELSYLNLYDAEAAWRLVHRFDDPAVVIVKHANPCGVAVGADITAAYIAANACDPVSAFGGIVAANRPVPVALAEALAPVFTEVVVAPSFDDDALAVLGGQEEPPRARRAASQGAELDLRTIDGGLLAQSVDRVSLDRRGWRVVTAAQPDEAAWRDLGFAWQVCAAVSSNAIVLTRAGQAVGIGAGQQNRLDSARIAVAKAAGRADGWQLRQRRLLPLPGRAGRGGRGRDPGRHPARRQRARRRGHRRRRRARHRHGLHRRAPLPALSRRAQAGQVRPSSPVRHGPDR